MIIQLYAGAPKPEDDIRVKRWIESGEIKTGDLVAVEYEGEISGSCEVTGAYSIFTGTLEENDMQWR